jgi:serine/threonine protein kinase
LSMTLLPESTVCLGSRTIFGTTIFGPDALARAGSGLVTGHPSWKPVREAAESWDCETADDIQPLQRSDPVRIGDYEVLARLGSGGMSRVFCALAPAGGLVAVKLFRGTTGVCGACVREYRLAHAVAAEFTAPVLGYGISPAGVYLVVSYLPGYRCAANLSVGMMAQERLWAFGGSLARALQSFERQGMVHCDIKPGNLLVCQGDVRVIDFGIARRTGEWFGRDGTVQCSRGWAAPEQLRVVPATPAVDVFAWGCVLAYLATGVQPFASNSAEEWILRVNSTRPDLFGMPTRLGELVARTLEHDPGNRPNAGDLFTECQLALDDCAIAAPYR